MTHVSCYSCTRTCMQNVLACRVDFFTLALHGQKCETVTFIIIHLFEDV